MTSVLLNENPDIIVSTPTRLHALLQSKAVNLAHLSFLAIDEADLLLSYGHKDDLTRIMDPSSGWVPRLGVQGCLMSATLGEDVHGVKGLVLRDPVRSHPLFSWISNIPNRSLGHSHALRAHGFGIPSDSTLHSHDRARQISSDICSPQAQTHPGQVHPLCQ